jgi:hypothetical protein
MRIRKVMIPENLSLPILADLITDLGIAVDRRSVGRSLQSVVIRGVVAPDKPTDRWRIPRAKLAECIGACLFRRRRRAPDRWSATPDECLLDAAGLMMRHGELWRHVPESLRRRVIERREARWREEAERRRQAEEAERRTAAELAERYARERREERERHEQIERERVAAAHEKVLDACYSACFRAAYRAIGAPGGPHWTQLPEAVQLRRDFPHDRPADWAAPPGMYEAMKADLPKQVVYGYVEPDWSRWIPPYRPGQPWPWRRAEADVVAA